MAGGSSDAPLAVFDLDGTLLRGDSFLPFLVSYARRRRRFFPLLLLPLFVAGYACRLLSARVAKEQLLIAFFRGRDVECVGEHAKWFTDAWVKKRLRGELLDRLRGHQEAGHRVILLSASPDLYVSTIGEALGVREVLATPVAVAAGRFDGRISGDNLKGPAKVEALKRHLGRAEPPPASVAYGDSSSDLPLLRWVETGYLVKRTGLHKVPAS